MDWSFGLTMTVIGMGVTFVTLLLLMFIIHLLNRIYPFKPGPPKDKPGASQ